MKGVIVISTSHIAEQSIKDIKKAFEKEPGAVAVELDARRLTALMNQQRTNLSPVLVKSIGLTGYLFAIVGSYLQRRLGGLVGMKPGTEMLTAVREGHKRGLQVYLIDQDVQITLHRLSHQVPLQEKLRLFKELALGMFRKTRIKIDLRKVPEKELIEALSKELKKKFPKMYKVLVTERNKVMARHIRAIKKEHPDEKLLVIVGAGHEKGLKKLLEKPI